MLDSTAVQMAALREVAAVAGALEEVSMTDGASMVVALGRAVERRVAAGAEAGAVATQVVSSAMAEGGVALGGLGWSRVGHR